MSNVESFEPPDEQPSTERMKLLAALSRDQVRTIENALLGNCSHTWRKVAFVVGKTFVDLSDRFEGVPDVYYAQKVKALVASCQLEAKGDLAYMRYSEVRIPSDP